MKYIMWESANFRNYKLAQALKDESYPIGKTIYFTMHEVVGQFFDYALWLRNGKKDLPYEFDTSLSDFMHDCRLSDEEEMLKILEKFQKYQLTDFVYDKDMGLLKLVCPNLMDMCDRYNKDNIRDADEEGIAFLKSYWENKATGNVMYGDRTEPVLQIIEEDKKLSKTKKSKLKKSKPTQEDTNIDDKKDVSDSLEKIRLDNRKLVANAIGKFGTKKIGKSIDDDVPF